jgi:hypothetical protein
MCVWEGERERATNAKGVAETYIRGGDENPEEKKLSVSRVSRALVNGDGIKRPGKAVSSSPPAPSVLRGVVNFYAIRSMHLSAAVRVTGRASSQKVFD